MLLSITENASGSTGGAMPQKALDTIWEWAASLPEASVEVLPEDPGAAEHLARRMKMLALPAPNRSRDSSAQAKVDGVEYVVSDGYFTLGDMVAVFMGGSTAPAGVEKIGLRFETNCCRIHTTAGDEEVTLTVAMDGSRAESILPGMPSIALCSGEWTEENVFTVTMRMVETCNEKYLTFIFSDDGAVLESYSNHVFASRKATASLKKI